MDASLEVESSSFHFSSLHQRRVRHAIPTMRHSYTPVLRHSFLNLREKEATALGDFTDVYCPSRAAKTDLYDFVLTAEEAREMRARPLWPSRGAGKVGTQRSSQGHPEEPKGRSILMVAKARHYEMVKRKNKTIYIHEIIFDATEIALPFANTPIIMRNQEKSGDAKVDSKGTWQMRKHFWA